MKLTILGSSSSGNCYLLHNENEALVVECGVKFMEVKKALNFDISIISGCIVSHEHGDHARYINEYLDAQIPVWTTAGTLENIVLKSAKATLIIEYKIEFTVGNFRILPFDVMHDCAEPAGFLIRHKECGTVLFATDTYYLRHKFKGLNNILIECNYSEDILFANINSGKLPAMVAERALQSHMSYDTCRKTLLANDLTKVNNIVLIHLSAGNSNEIEFMQGIQEATGKTVHIA
ncbi:MAG: MBL fold metallo-hydrolase, partial [Prevotellaceae bacterium]|nr:MBL fold metallo-hydrolase [Prevotellaceae bacterium]